MFLNYTIEIDPLDGYTKFRPCIKNDLKSFPEKHLRTVLLFVFYALAIELNQYLTDTLVTNWFVVGGQLVKMSV